MLIRYLLYFLFVMVFLKMYLSTFFYYSICQLCLNREQEKQAHTVSVRQKVSISLQIIIRWSFYLHCRRISHISCIHELIFHEIIIR